MHGMVGSLTLLWREGGGWPGLGALVALGEKPKVVSHLLDEVGRARPPPAPTPTKKAFTGYIAVQLGKKKGGFSAAF